MYGYIGRGEFIVVLDSQDRENEGDLIIAAEAITTEKMAFMIRYTRYVTTPRFCHRQRYSCDSVGIYVLQSHAQ